MRSLSVLVAAASALACSPAEPALFSPAEEPSVSGQAGGGSGNNAVAAGSSGSPGSGGQPLGGGAAVAGGAGAAAGGAGMAGQASAVDVGLSVLERNGDAARSGHFRRPLLDHASVKRFFFARDFKSTFAGDVQASPLYLEKGPGGRGAAFVVTTGGDVHALDVETGALVWSAHVGDAPPGGSVGCAPNEVFGIPSTPVIDPGTRTLYVAAGVGQTMLERHEIHALSVDDGKERPGFPLDVSTLTSGFDAKLQHQTSALSLVGGILYVAYGGAQDCGERHGWVFALDTQNPNHRGVWRSQSAGAGVDASAGLASDGVSVFFTTGSDAKPADARGDSQALVRLVGIAPANGDEKDLFFPASWQAMNQSGASLGASNPLLVDVPGATPASYVAALGSDGHLYLRDRNDLGAALGSVDFSVASGSPTAIKTAPTTYRTAKGTYLALTAAHGVTCPVGSPAPPAVNTGQVVVSIRLDAAAPTRPQIAWCYYLIAGQGAPVSTTTDGSTDATVWFMDDVKLLGLDGDTGQVLFDGGHDISGVPFAERTCPGVAPYTSPIPVGGRMMIAGNGRLCAWAPQ